MATRRGAIALGSVLCVCLCALNFGGHPREVPSPLMYGPGSERVRESRCAGILQFGLGPNYGHASTLSDASSSSMDTSPLTSYTTTWKITNMAITGESPDKRFSFDIYTALTGTPEDYKVCAHSLRILYNADELENPTVPSELSTFYKKSPPSYIAPWDTMGYFHIVETMAGSDHVIVNELDMALMSGAYVDEGYTNSLLSLLSTDGERMLCRV